MKKIIMALSLCVFSLAAFARAEKSLKLETNAPCYIETTIKAQCPSGTDAFWGTITTKVDCLSQVAISYSISFVSNPCGSQQAVENFLP